MIAAREPKDPGDHRGEAYAQICHELKADDFVLAGERDAEAEVAFARLPEPPVLALSS
jgi:hypothetical protein